MIYHWLGGERKYIMKTLKEIRMKKRLKRLVENWMRNHNMKKKYSCISPKKQNEL